MRVRDKYSPPQPEKGNGLTMCLPCGSRGPSTTLNDVMVRHAWPVHLFKSADWGGARRRRRNLTAFPNRCRQIAAPCTHRPCIASGAPPMYSPMAWYKGDPRRASRSTTAVVPVTFRASDPRRGCNLLVTCTKGSSSQVVQRWLPCRHASKQGVLASFDDLMCALSVCMCLGRWRTIAGRRGQGD